MTVIQFGNTASVEHYKTDEDQIAYRTIEGERITEVSIPDGRSFSDMLNMAKGILAKHQEVDINDIVAPVFVRSDNETLQNALVEEFGITNNRIPAGYGSEHDAVNRLFTPMTAMLALPLYIGAVWGLSKLSKLNLRTNYR